MVFVSPSSGYFFTFVAIAFSDILFGLQLKSADFNTLLQILAPAFRNLF